MTCEQCIEQLSLYIDGMLTEKEEKEVVAHLTQCETCQEEYSQFKVVADLLHDEEEIDLPEGFHENLMNKIHQEHQVIPLKAKKTWWRYSAGLVATLFIGIVTMTQFSHLTRQNKSDSVIPQVAKATPFMVTEHETTHEVASEENLKGIAIAPHLDEEQLQDIGRAYTENSNLDEAPVQSAAIWEIEVIERADFLTDLKAYMEEVGLVYTENDLEILISGGANHEGIKAFIENDKRLVKLTILNAGEYDLKLVFAG